MSLFEVDTIVDHAARAVARLVTQFKNATGLKGLLTSISGEVQALEDSLTMLRLQIRDIDAAESDALDKIGDLVGAPVRGPRDDASYRARIKATIIVNKSRTTAANIYTIAKGIVDAWNVDGQPIIIESQPACFTIECDGPTALTNDDEQARELARVLNGSRLADGAIAAGVRAIVMSRPDTVATDDFFRFAGGSGPSAGFGVGKFRGAYDK